MSSELVCVVGFAALAPLDVEGHLASRSTGRQEAKGFRATIAFSLRQAETGRTVEDTILQPGIAEQTSIAGSGTMAASGRPTHLGHPSTLIVPGRDEAVEQPHGVLAEVVSLGRSQRSAEYH